MNAGEPGNILSDLGITSNQYAYASTCFSVTFIAFEIPSNFIVKWSSPRVSPSLDFTSKCRRVSTADFQLHYFRIVVIWSIITVCTAGCSNLAGFLTCRGASWLYLWRKGNTNETALLGAAEAGLYPGMLWQ